LKKDLKRQIRQDEFRSGVEHAVAWVREHKREARLITVLLALVGLSVGGLTYFRARQTALGEEALAEAMDVFEAPLEGDLPAGAPRPGGPIFGSATDKFTKAAAAFDGVERRFGSRPAGLRAKYYGALCRAELGKLDETEKALTELAARRDPGALEPALARLALGDLHRRAGRVDKAVEAYRHLVDDASQPLPRDHALMSLAQTLEQARRLGEARDAYRRLVEQFPASSFVTEARQKVAYLEAASQG
jgi:tetratricopeptide (TPR) repeat protein